MKLPFFTTLFLITAAFAVSVDGQIRKPAAAKAKLITSRSPDIGQTVVVEDETLSILRVTPSLFASSIQRMRRGRKMQILAVTEADGVKFYKVAAPPSSFGWIQSDAVFGRFRMADEERLAKLVQALHGFDQIETAVEFFNLYPKSKFRPSILLLFGDLLEEVAVKLSKDATNRLIRKEMAASAAPLHSYYLNFVSLDRYRKLGIIFLFNSETRHYHYDGASWKEIVSRFPASIEVAEAQKRLDSLTTKMEKSAAN